jgi:hypothetical protein
MIIHTIISLLMTLLLGTGLPYGLRIIWSGMPLMLYPRKDSRDTSDISPSHPYVKNDSAMRNTAVVW